VTLITRTINTLRIILYGNILYFVRNLVTAAPPQYSSAIHLWMAVSGPACYSLNGAILWPFTPV